MKNLTLLEGERTDNRTGYKAEYLTEKVQVSLQFICLLIHSPPALVSLDPGKAVTTTPCWNMRRSHRSYWNCIS